MPEKTNKERIEELQKRLDQLSDAIYGLGGRVSGFYRDLADLKNKVEQEEAAQAKTVPEETPAAIIDIPKLEQIEGEVAEPEPVPQPVNVTRQESVPVPPKREPKAPVADENAKEKFWGQNVLGKIGVCIAVIGIIALLKYLFDRDFMTTAVKVGFGYLASAVAVVLSYKYQKDRKILSSILYIGGIALSYLLTFLSSRYFELFGSTTSLIVSGGIALLSCVVGYFKSTPLLNVSAFMLYLAPIGSHVYLNDFTFSGYAVFVYALALALCVIALLKKSELSIVSALVMLVLFYVMSMLDAPDSICSGHAWAGFLVIMLAQTAFTLRNKNYDAFVVTLFNVLFSYITIWIKASGYLTVSYNLLAMFAVFAIVSYLCYTMFSDVRMSNTNLVFAAVLFNISLLHILIGRGMVYILPTVLLIEAAAMLVLSYRTDSDYHEKASYVLYTLGRISVLTIFWYYYNSNVQYMMLNTGFLSFMFFAVGSYLLSIYYKSDRRKEFPFWTSFVVLLTGILTENVANWTLYVPSALSELRPEVSTATSVDISLVFFTLMIVLAKYSRCPEKMTKVASVALLIVQLLFCYPALIMLDDISWFGNFSYEVVSLVIMALSVTVLFRTKLSEGNRLKELLQYFYIGTIFWLELVFKFDDSDVLQLWISLLMALYAGALFIIGFRYKKQEIRWFGIILAILISLKIVIYDVWNYSLAVKSVVFLLVGGIFLLISYLYSKYLKGKE